MFDLKIENVLIESAKLSLREWQLSLHGDDRTIQAKKIVAVELSLVDKDVIKSLILFVKMIKLFLLSAKIQSTNKQDRRVL